MRISHVLRLTALGLTLGLVACGSPDTDAPATEVTNVADAVYLNGKIITVDDENPKAQAVAIKDGKIIYVGDVRGSKPFTAESTRQIDLQGKTMVPGFVDAHGHVVSAGLQAASANLLPLPDGPVNSFAELTETLIAWAQSDTGTTFVDETGWLAGFGFDDSQLEEQVFPTAQVLDQVSQDKPVLIIHQSGHFGVLNRKGLELAGITDCRRQIPGGVIRCASGTASVLTPQPLPLKPATRRVPGM